MVAVCKHHCLDSTVIRTRPFETCLYCAQKHLSSALAMSVFDFTGKNPIVVRIASQVQLAAWHFGNTYSNEYDRCLKIINNIFQLKPYKEQLTELTEISWNDLSISLKHFSDDENILIKSDKNFKAACLHVANAVELLKFEKNYQNINYSYAVGQLVLANWIFEDIDKSLADKCRSMYHDVELENLNLEDFEVFRNSLWDRYLNKYI